MWRRKQVITGMAAALAVLAWPLAQQAAKAETMELDSLASLYEPVAFDHSMHEEMLEGDCARCHHHTLGTGNLEPACVRCHENDTAETVACRDCHATERFGAAYLQEQEQDVSRYHFDQPGLKAAYHLNCLGCHQETGGPTGCQDCHALTEAGEAFYRTGEYAPAGGTEEHGSGH